MFKNMILEHTRNFKTTYIKTAVIFLIGICFGVISVNWLENVILELSKDYFETFCNSILNIENIKFVSILLKSLKSELSFLGIIFLLSCSIIGEKLNYLLIGYRGFSLGYAFSSILRIYGTKRGILFFFITIGLNKIIYIPIFIFFCVYSINFCKKIKTKNDEIKINFIKYLVLFMIVLLTLSLLQSFQLTISYKMLKKM